MAAAVVSGEFGPRWPPAEGSAKQRLENTDLERPGAPSQAIAPTTQRPFQNFLGDGPTGRRLLCKVQGEACLGSSWWRLSLALFTCQSLPSGPVSGARLAADEAGSWLFEIEGQSAGMSSWVGLLLERELRSEAPEPHWQRGATASREQASAVT